MTTGTNNFVYLTVKIIKIILLGSELILSTPPGARTTWIVNSCFNSTQLTNNQQLINNISSDL